MASYAWIAALMGLVLLFGFAPAATASVLIAPARFEIEVGATGAGQTLTMVNRGRESIWSRVYAGGAMQRPDGAITYLDDEAARQAANDYILLETSTVHIPPESHVVIPVRFLPLGERVSFYPVIFAEMMTHDTGAMSPTNRWPSGAPVETVTRIAVPVLITNAMIRHEQSFRPVLSDLDVKPVTDARALEVTLRVTNDGNVHGEIAGEIALFDATDQLVESLPVRAGRILPEATRDISIRWPTPQAHGQARIVASVSSANLATGAEAPPTRIVSVYWDTVDDALRVSVLPMPALVTQRAGAPLAAPLGVAPDQPESE